MTANNTPEPGIDAGAGPEGGAAMPDPYSVSHLRHELRTPINHIIGYSELPLAEAEDRPLKPFTSDLKKIHTADKTLLAMISTLFESPTLTTGSRSSLPQPAGDLSRLCDEDADRGSDR